MPAPPEQYWHHTDEYPAGRSFGELLDWHLVHWGTRPGGSKEKKGKIWAVWRFAAAAHGISTVDKKGEDFDSESKNLRNWREGKCYPSDDLNHGKIRERILNILFAGEEYFREWEADLQSSFDRPLELGPFAKATAGRLVSHSIYKNTLAEDAEQPSQTKIGNLVPSQTGYFIGRDEVVEAHAREILASRGGTAILVHGGPGIGKTELTKAVAHHPDIAASYAERRWFIALDAVRDMQGMLKAFGSALGTDPALGIEAIVTRLGFAPSLLILDNIETPWEQVEEIQSAVEAFLVELSHVPALALIASKRGSKIVQGIAWTRVHDVKELARPDAAQLFLKIAHFENPTDPFFGKFMKALGGVPLAITLVALRAQGFTSLRKLWSEWERIGAELARKRGSDVTRHTSLVTSIEFSLNSPLLDERAKRLFAILGRTPDGLTERERNVIAGDDSFELEESLRWVGLAFERDGRIRLLPPIREYANRLLLKRDDNLCWTHCFLDPTRALRDDVSLSYDENFINFQWIRDSLNNIESSILYLIDSNDGNELELYLDGLMIVSRRYGISLDASFKMIDYFSKKDGKLSYAQSLLIQAHVADRIPHLELTEISFKLAITLLGNEGDDRALISAHQQYGEYQNRRARHRGRDNFLRARKISREIHDELGEFNAKMGLGMASLLDSSYNTARITLEECVIYYQKQDLGLRSAECSDALATIYEIQSYYEGALDHYEFAESVWREHGFKRELAKCLISKSGLYFKKGENSISQNISMEALEIFTELGDEKGIADCLYRNATLRYYQDNDLNSAIMDLERAEDIYTRTNDKNGLGYCTYFRALATSWSEHPDAYEEFLLLARDHFRSAGNSCEQAQCSYEIASLAFLQERYDKTMEFIVEAFAEFSQRGDPVGAMNCQILFADLQSSADDLKAAENLLMETLEISREIGSQFHEAQALDRLGDIFSKHQRHNEAREAYRQAAALYKLLSMPDDEATCLGKLQSYDYD